MYSHTGRLKQRRRGRRAPSIIEPLLPYPDLMEFLSLIDLPAIEQNVESFFVTLNRVAIQLKDRQHAELACEELFNLVFHKFLNLLNNKQSCVRTVVLRIFRLLLVTERVLQQYLHYRIDIVVLRALDMHLNAEAERIQALKMMVRMIEIYRIADTVADRVHFRKSFLQSAVSVVRSALPKKSGEQRTTDEELKRGNRLWLAALGILMETSVCEPKLVIDAVGTEWMVRILMEPGITQRIIGQLCRVLIAWLDCPTIRVEGRLSFIIGKLFSPLIEITFFHDALSTADIDRGSPGDPEPQESRRSPLYGRVGDTLENCTFVFLNIIRSWTGLFCCAALDESLRPAIASPIRFLEFLGIGSVVSPNLGRVRDKAIDIWCQFVDLPYAERKFTTWNEALEYYATMHHPDRFKCSLSEDFVLAEYAPPFNDHVDLLGSFRAAAIYALVNAGVSKILVRLILSTPDESSGIKATLLLSDLLRTGASILPRDWRIRLMSMESVVGEDYRGGEILVHRLNQLNELILTRATRTTVISNMELFVQCDNEPEKLPHEKTTSKKKGQALSESAIRTLLDELLPDSVDHGVINWQKVDLVLQGFESDEGWRALQNCKHNDRCHAFFSEIVAFFLSHKAQFLKLGMDQERFVVECGCRLFRLLAPLCDELHYLELLELFVKDFAEQLHKENLQTGVFAPRNVMNSGAMYYFALIGAVSSTKMGCEVMTQTMLFQIFLDYMVATTPVEYVKLITSCLDYSAPDGLARLILETAMTATNEKGRKWVTRFLGTSPAFRNEAFSIFVSRLLLKQLGDASVKVVRHAVRVLHQWLPLNPSAYETLVLLGPTLNALGDAGVLLRTHTYASESITRKNLQAAEDFLMFWDNVFHERYVEVVEDEMREALTPIKRTSQGGFARASSERNTNWGVAVPIHLYGVLARHKTGQNLLQRAQIVDKLLGRLHGVQKFNFDTECLSIKAALLGLGHIIGNLPRDQFLVPAEAVPVIARFAEECPLLSVRGTAFWAMNIISAGEFGAIQLAQLGWESNRHLGTLEEAKLGISDLSSVPRTFLSCFDDVRRLETVDEEPSDQPPECGEVGPLSDALLESILSATNSNRVVEDEPEEHFANNYRIQLGMKQLRTKPVKHEDGVNHSEDFRFKRCAIPTDLEIASADAYREIFEGHKYISTRQTRAMHSTWSFVSLPSEIHVMTEHIFDAPSVPKKLSVASLGRGNDGCFVFEHNPRTCFHCTRSRRPAEVVTPSIKQEVLYCVSRLEILQWKVHERRLLEIYRSNNDVFLNPCLYADVLELLSERRYKLATRSFLHQLFWKAFQVNL